MLSCAEVVRQIASDEAVNASFVEKLRLRIHLAICKHCSEFAWQLRGIGKAVKDASTAVSDLEVVQARTRIMDGIFGR